MQKIEPTLYISYDQRDKELVLALMHDLRRQRISTLFRDHKLVEFGGDWESALTNEIAKVDCVLLLFTPNSLTANYVKHEFDVARDVVLKSDGRKMLLPVVYGGIEIPYFLKGVQVIIANSKEEVIDRIVKAVFNFVAGPEIQEANHVTAETPIVSAAHVKPAGKNKTENPAVKSTSKIDEESKKGAGEKGGNRREETPEAPAGSATRNHWLLKMNPRTWKIDQLRAGKLTFFNTHYYKEKRPEYRLFEKVTKGDYVLGFASGKHQSVVCEMEVVKPVGPNHQQGESFTMVVHQLANPPVPVNKFRNKIAQLARLEQDTRPPELFFELSEADYNAILSSGSSQDETIDKVYQPYFLSEGNHGATRDQLDFENDYNSFASVIVLKRVTPPLAIGLFGNWGSGKSFFMEKLSQRIEELAESKDPEYVEHVVPVKFNSWHYSDTNLWASLTTQIFESLNDYAQKKAFGAEAIEAIYKDLNITGAQLEETKRKLAANEVQANVLKRQKDDKEEIIRQKKETLDLWKKKDFVKLVFSDPYIQSDFRDIKEQFDKEKLIDNIGEIENKYAEIDSTGDRIRKSFDLLKENSKGNWRWIWILGVLFGIAGWLALGPLKAAIENIISGATVITGLVITWVVNFIARVSPYMGKVNQFYRRLKSLKETVEKEREKVRLKEHDEVQRLQEDIDGLTQETANLEAEQMLTEEKRERLQNEIKEIGSGKLLANFLAGKSADDAYIKQLGIISWIRKDFSKLNELFQNQRLVQAKENDTTPVVQIDRIVLYIDDLDRCNEDVVIKVLEAIHLLLAFPLFVVVVGVDPRWLNNALSEKYRNLFGGRRPKESDKKDSTAQQNQDDKILAATSYDYLEKIFQIPFALKPINKTGREKLIQYLIKDEMDGKPSDIPLQVQGTVRKEEAAASPVTPQAAVEKKGALDAEKQKEVAKKVRERLVFTDAELSYLKTISPLFGQTPRTINRYVNIYRIIKAHGNLRVAGSFSEDEFMPLMFILGVVVGHSAFAEEFIAEISEAKDASQFREFLKGKKLNKSLVAQIKPMTAEIEAMSMDNFKRNLELISRFSFRTLLK